MTQGSHWFDSRPGFGTDISRNNALSLNIENSYMDLVWETYKAFAFGDPNAETKYQQYVREAEGELNAKLQLPNDVRKAAQEGKRAYELNQIVEQKLNQGVSPSSITEWIETLRQVEAPRVIKGLRNGLSKKTAWQENKQALRQDNSDFVVSLPYTNLIDGVHPNSLRALQPSTRWDIYIDETGKEFSDQAKSLDETDQTLGRIVALALPENTTLPELGITTHATEASHKEIEALLRAITTSNSGVIGATLKSDLHSYSWIAAIAKLVKWILLMLPVSKNTFVTFKIENRGEYQDSLKLKALEETLLDDLRHQTPERFDKLNLSLTLIGKDTHFNGYVDAIANCWGSPQRIKHALLERTGWPGHCLLQSTDLAEIDRLYREANGEPEPEAWFAMCSHVTKEPGHSVFIDILARLGQRAQSEPLLWRKYLEEARFRLANKRFDSASLAHSLEWLNEFHPSSERLPALLKLQMQSAQLASANHKGHSDKKQMALVMDSAEALIEESAHDACEAALRIASSATNGFDFSTAVPYIEKWIVRPIAMQGRLNQGKLHSTLGQLCAFRAEYSEAQLHFDAAINEFEQLSDPELVASNRRQTATYKAVALLDAMSPQAEETIRSIIEEATAKTGNTSIRDLARSASALRYEHSLLLRWLIHDPEESRRQAYLDCINNWQSHDGHPWMLINGYRAWLLIGTGREKEASMYLQKAIDHCSDSVDSSVLHWMAYCLHALGESLGIVLTPTARPCPGAPFPGNDLRKLQEAKSDKARLQALQTLLPFSFH